MVLPTLPGYPASRALPMQAQKPVKKEAANSERTSNPQHYDLKQSQPLNGRSLFIRVDGRRKPWVNPPWNFIPTKTPDRFELTCYTFKRCVCFS